MAFLRGCFFETGERFAHYRVFKREQVKRVMEIYRFGFNAMGGDGEVVIAFESQKEAHSLANLALTEVGRIEYKYSLPA